MEPVVGALAPSGHELFNPKAGGESSTLCVLVSDSQHLAYGTPADVTRHSQ